MTTLLPIQEKCVLCDQVSEQVVVGSTNAFGSQDIDMRPPPMMRSTLPYQIQHCPHCGYCAPSLVDAIPNAASLIQASPYQDQLHNPDYPEKANHFLCAAFLYQLNQQWLNALWQTLRAAWVCDDAQEFSAADRCRQRAIELIETLTEEGISLGQEVGLREVLLSDLLRRSGQFEAAEMICEEGIAKKPDATILKILLFAKDHALQFDRRCYTVQDALK